MSHDDFESEPIPGLPARPPQGEAILWQGSPHWPTVARRVLHVDLVAGYLALWIGWRIVSQMAAGSGVRAVAGSALWPALLSAAALAILLLIAWGVGRTTVYTITSRRIAMRFGIALPVTFNLPFRALNSVAARSLGRGRGDIALRLDDGTRLAFFVLWPHARPWRLKSPQPMLRALPQVDEVAAILADAVSADAMRAGSAYAGTTRQSAGTPKPIARPARHASPAMIAAE